MIIAGRAIDQQQPPYCIAEISGNHLGEIYNCFELIKHAKACGADAVKLQCYTADSITIDHDSERFIIHDGPWAGRKLYDLYEEAHTPPSWFPDLMAYAKHVGIVAFASVFDNWGVDLMHKLGAPAIKISSFDINDIPLIQHAATTGLPLIISTGMASAREVIQADDCLPEDHERLFLHCVSGYPTPIEESDLQGMRRLKNLLQMDVGLSDHCLGNEVVCAAVALGAVAIEKHLTSRRSAGGPDAKFSLEPSEFTEMVAAAKAIHQSLRAPPPAVSEALSLPYRKGLYIVADVSAGQQASYSNVRAIRPAGNLPPASLPEVVGKSFRRALKRGDPVSASDLE